MLVLFRNLKVKSLNYLFICTQYVHIKMIMIIKWWVNKYRMDKSSALFGTVLKTAITIIIISYNYKLRNKNTTSSFIFVKPKIWHITLSISERGKITV